MQTEIKNTSNKKPSVSAHASSLVQPIELVDYFRYAIQITHHKEREQVDEELVNCLTDLVKSGQQIPSFRLFKISQIAGKRNFTLTAFNDSNEVHAANEELEEKNLPKQLVETIDNRLAQSTTLTNKAGQETHQYWFPIYKKIQYACLECSQPLPLSKDQKKLILSILTLYTNYISLLHYSQIDTLTGLLNRKTFDNNLDALLLEPYNNSLANQERREDDVKNEHWLAVIDLDHFKKVNDQYGHIKGDLVLIALANIMKSIFRKQDKLFRFGGEEFVILMRNTAKKNVMNVFERLRQAVQNHSFTVNKTVTVSIGITMVYIKDNPTLLLGRADNALYYAKAHGRNQIWCYEDLIEQGLALPLKEPHIPQ